MVKETKEPPLKDKMVRILKPKECALIYDEKNGKILAICNRNGKPEITLEKKIEEI